MAITKAGVQNVGKHHRTNVDKIFQCVKEIFSIAEHACLNKMQNAKHILNWNFTNNRVHPINNSN